MEGAGNNGLIILRNSNYTNKYIVDADQLNYNFQKILDSAGTASFKDLIEATGQIYNPLVSTQLINAIVQLIVASNYFKDTGTVNNIILEAYTPGYGIPTQYINNMTLKFRPAYQNTGVTTLAVKGMSPVKVLTDTGAELSSGSLITTQDYTVVYDSSKAAFVLSSSFVDSGSQAMAAIKELVESAGITFSSALSFQLSQAIALYSLATTYDTVVTSTSQQSNNYILKPFGNFEAAPQYVEGMLFRFRPPYVNTLTNPTAQLENLPRYTIYNSNGDALQAGDLNIQADVVLKFTNNTFRLISNRINSLQLTSGPTVNTIVNDVSLSGNSETSLVTEYAVKSYVDAKVKAEKVYCVISAQEENNQAAYISQTGPTTLNILAGEPGQPSYKNIANTSNVIAAPNRPDEVDPEDPEEITTFGPSNMFNGDNSSYYETLAQGSDILGVKDPVTGEYTTEPAYVGAKDLNEAISRVSLLGYTSVNSPQQVAFQYSTVYSSGGGYTWQNVGEIEEYIDPDTGELKKRIIPTTYNLPFIGGTPNDIDLSDFVPRADATDLTSQPVYPYAFRVVPTQFTGTGGWEVVSLELSTASTTIAPLVVAYADESLETVSKQNIVDTTGYDGNVWIIRLQGTDFQVVSYNSLTESFDEPTSPEEGDFWTKLSSSKLETFIYGVTESDPSGAPISYGWIKQNYVKIGSANLTNGAINSFYPLAIGGKYSNRNLSFESSPMTITHHIGNTNTSRLILTCISTDGTYNPGDTVELSNYSILVTGAGSTAVTTVGDTEITIAPHDIAGSSYPHSISPNPHNHTAVTTFSGNLDSSYSTVVSTVDTAVILYKNIALPDKVSGVVTPLNLNNWKISIVCERSF